MKRILLCFLQLTCCLLTVHAQQISERIFVQTDRDQYNKGETIHFKAFVSSADTAGAGTQLFVELRDSLLQPLTHVCVPVIDGTASGSLLLPRNTPSAVFFLRAYTDLSFADRASCQYVQVFSPQLPVPHPGIAAVQSPVFFPEGGSLVAGAVNYIVFRVPPGFTGEISNSRGERIAGCQPFSQGLGILSFRAMAGEQYHCAWQSEGKEYRTDLPPVTDNAVALHLRQTTDTLFFDIDNGGNRSLHLLKPKVQLLIGEELAYVVELNMMTRNQFSYFIPLTGFQPAMARIRVLDTEDRVLASRPLFISRYSQLNPDALLMKNINLDRRAENQLEIDFRDKRVSHLSVRITDARYLAPTYVPGLLQALLPPGFRDYPDLRQAYDYWQVLDLALQSDPSLAVDHPVRMDTLTPERPPHLTLTAQIKKGKKWLSEKDILLGIRSPYTGKELYKLKTDSLGRVQLSNLVLYGETFVHARLPNQSEEELNVSFTLTRPMPNPDSLFFQAFRDKAERLRAAIPPADLSADKKEMFPLAEDSIEFAGTVTLEEVVVKFDSRLTALKRLEELEKKYVDGTNFSGYTATGETLDVMNDPRTAKFLDIFSYIGMNMRGVTLMTVRGDKQLFVMGRGTGGTNTMVTVFYLGNSRVDRDMLNGIRLDEVALIKYIPMLGTERGFPPAIAIFLKKPGDQGYWEKDRYQFIEQTLNGYSVTKDFVEPDYSNPETKVISDQRKTLAWRPYVPVENGKAEIRFYNNDSTRQCRITVMGLAADGSILFLEKLIQ